MGNTIFGIFILLHGLVHIWYIVLAQQWVAFKPEMGFSGESWMFTKRLGDSATRKFASANYAVSTFLLVIAAIAILMASAWKIYPLLFGSMSSAVTIIIFWDGKKDKIIEKGLLGFIIDVTIIAVILFSILIGNFA